MVGSRKDARMTVGRRCAIAEFVNRGRVPPVLDVQVYLVYMQTHELDGSKMTILLELDAPW